jgi:6-phosphogluconolactonase
LAEHGTRKPSTIVRCASRDSVIAAATGLVQRAAEQAIEERGRFLIALAGGSTPRPLYEALARESGIDWSRWMLFWGDERSVPPEDEESNYHMVEEALLHPLAARGVAPGAVERMRGEIEPTTAALEYEARLLSLADGAVPVLDLVLLGMGSDGHTASLFPETGALHEQERIIVANPVPKLAATRLTLTFPLINAARTLLVLVSGADKAEALAAVHGSVRDLNRWPSQGLNPGAGELIWLVDEAAAGLLPPAPESAGI